MSYTVLLLACILVGLVTCQTATSMEVPETGSRSKEGDSQITTKYVEVLKPEESVDKFTFTKADAIPVKQQIQTEDNPQNDPLVIFETILNGEKEIQGKKVSTVTIDKDEDNTDDDADDDDDDEEDGDDDEDELDDEVSSDSLKPLISKPSDLQIRRQGDLNPNFDIKEQNFLQPRQDISDRMPYNSPYTTRDRIVSSDSVADNSPLLLTQGGYQRPPNSRRGPNNNQRPISEIASLQSETVERPDGTQTDRNQQGSPRLAPQVSYTSGYQPQMEYMQVFRHPMDPSGSFLSQSGPIPNSAQNPFFHASPSPYHEFTSANIQSPFAMSGNVFTDVSRDANGFPQYQSPPIANPNLMFQTPSPFIQPQPMSEGIQRPVHNPFQQGFSPYAGVNNAEPTSRPDYSVYFRSPAAPTNTQQFQFNPNFYGAIPTVEGVGGFNNPSVNSLQGYPSASNGSPFSTTFMRYPIANNQVPPPQNTDQQVQRQQQESEIGTSDQKPKDSEQLSVSQDKEDPLAVPFGTRIQRQNDSPDQNGFPIPRDVYIRYPMSEAGYATEENLPVQNTTERNSGTNVAAERPTFPFFTGGRLYPGFSNPDPYRNALNAIQQSYPRENSRTNKDDTNSTKEIPAVRDTPLRFNQGSLPRARPPFNEYPGVGGRDAPVIQRSPFYPPGAVGSRSPFDPIPVFPERNYPFAAQEQASNSVEENSTPTCAKESNASLCFNDPEYPRRELLYALNSESFLLDRLVMPNQELDGISLVEQNTTESPESPDNYICQSDLKYGMPLRAKNIKGMWKVIVNIERAIGGGKFIQPVRLEVCRSANKPCSFATELKTACVQKYSLHRLLSWSTEMGVHNDVYKLPVACSCQVVKEQL